MAKVKIYTGYCFFKHLLTFSFGALTAKYLWNFKSVGFLIFLFPPIENKYYFYKEDNLNIRI
jgi:hypothetical protein